MKASELIERLQAMIMEHGDLTVTTCDEYYQCDIDDIAFRERDDNWHVSDGIPGGDQLARLEQLVASGEYREVLREPAPYGLTRVRIERVVPLMTFEL